MAIYKYRAVSANGKLKEGKLEADSEPQARKILKTKGFSSVKITERPQDDSDVRNPRLHLKAPPPEVSAIIRQLSILLNAGIPLVETLYGLSEQTKSKQLSQALKEIAEHVSQGASLSESLSLYPRIFPNLSVEMTKVAEAGGNLSETMNRLADYLETADEIRRKVKAAMAYPVVVMSVSILAIVGMIVFIVPRFTKMFSRMGTALPATTQFLVDLSASLTHYWYIYLIILTSFVVFWRVASKKDVFRKITDKIILKMPLIGDVASKIIMARTMSVLASLLGSGVTMVKALETAAFASNNEIVKIALLDARKDVAEGSATSASLRTTGIFPPLVLQLVAGGEKTGDLPTMLNYVCSLYNREVEAKVKSLTSVIEPIMILGLGLVVGFIAISIILPIYSVVNGGK